MSDPGTRRAELIAEARLSSAERLRLTHPELIHDLADALEEADRQLTEMRRQWRENVDDLTAQYSQALGREQERSKRLRGLLREIEKWCHDA